MLSPSPCLLVGMGYSVVQAATSIRTLKGRPTAGKRSNIYTIRQVSKNTENRMILVVENRNIKQYKYGILYYRRNGGTRHGDQATHNNSKNRRDTVRKNHDEKFLKINFNRIINGNTRNSFSQNK
jgi:hypothetical protein